MEEKNTGLIVLIIILFVIVLTLSSYIFIDKFLVIERRGNTSNKTNIVNNNSEEKSLVKDSSKEVVYNNENYLPDNEVPYINIDSKDAERLNEEIEEYYKSVINDYYDSIIYNYYVSDDIVSIVVRYMPGGSTKEYKVYKINKETGYEVTNSDILKIKNITKETLITKMKAIFLERVKTTEAYSMHIYGDEFTTVEQATNRNIENLSLDTALIYLNDNNNLCVIEEEYQIAGAETGNYIMNIDKSSYIEFK